MTEIIATAIGGSLLTWLSQILKRATGLTGKAMLWAVFGLSILVAALFTFAQGGEIFSNPETLLQAGVAILGASQLLYGAVKKKMNLSGNQPPNRTGV